MIPLNFNSNTGSFFDEEGVQFVFKPLGPKTTHPQELSQKPILLSFLYCKDLATGETTPGSFALHSTLLTFYGSDISKPPKRVLNLAHSRLKIQCHRKAGSHYSLTVVRNEHSYELSFPEKQTLDEWIFGLRRVCVLDNISDEYKTLRAIGKGSFATVYLVEAIRTGKRFAVKAFKKENASHPDRIRAKAGLINEINTLRSLDHENLIKLYEVYETERSVYLVLELVEGRVLESSIRKQSYTSLMDPSLTQAANVLSQILSAVAYMSSKGFIHRDLKPTNILIDETGKIKIVDFGFVTSINQDELIYRKCGTPGYIPPEVFKYDQNSPSTYYNDRFDLFSVGCILFYMLFGYPAFKGANTSEILLQNKEVNAMKPIKIVKDELVTYQSKVNKEGLNLILKLLECDPKKRISASEALAHPFALIPPKWKVSPSTSTSSKEFSPTTGGLKIKLNLEEDHEVSFQNLCSPRSGDVSPFTENHQLVKKDSLFLNLGRCEMNGKVDSLSAGSNNSLFVLNNNNDDSLSPRSPRTNPTTPSSFAANKKGILSAQKSKGLAKSFKVKNSGNNGFLKAAIIHNIQKNGEYEDIEEVKPHKKRRSLTAEISDKIQTSSFLTKLRTIQGTTHEEEEEENADVDDEGSNISEDYEKFVERSPKVHMGYMLESKSGFNSPSNANSPKTGRLGWGDVQW